MEKELNPSTGPVVAKILLAVLLMALAIFISDYTGRHLGPAQESAAAGDTTALLGRN